jgi:acyl carrier protein phosphodiesterase
MNFLAHAVLAQRVDPDPRFVLGAVLPDFAAMAGLEWDDLDDEALQSGVKFHGRTDEVFHAAEDFLALLRVARADLHAAGLERAKRLAASHVGFELLFDGWLARDDELVRSFRSLLLASRRGQHGLVCRWREPYGAWRWGELIEKLLASPVPEAYSDPAFAAESVGRILARRPRFALSAGELDLVRAWMPRAQAMLEAAAEGVFEYTVSRTSRGSPCSTRRGPSSRSSRTSSAASPATMRSSRGPGHRSTT